MDRSKRNFLKRYFREQITEVCKEFRKGIQTADQKASFERYFDSYESSYALTLAYPDDILLETARRHGIKTKGREKTDIIKELFETCKSDEYRF